MMYTHSIESSKTLNFHLRQVRSDSRARARHITSDFLNPYAGFGFKGYCTSLGKGWLGQSEC